MEAVAREKGEQRAEKKVDSHIDELLARKAKKEELRRRRLKKASFFWFSVFMYCGLIVLLAVFIYKATGISEMLTNLEKRTAQIVTRERAARGVIHKSVRAAGDPTSEETEVVAPPVPNVVILQHSGRMEGVHYKVSGQIQNTGTAGAIDVMVTATFYDSSGAPVGKDTDHVWRRVSSVEPNQKLEFRNIMPSSEAPKITKYDLVVKWY